MSNLRHFLVLLATALPFAAVAADVDEKPMGGTVERHLSLDEPFMQWVQDPARYGIELSDTIELREGLEDGLVFAEHLGAQLAAYGPSAVKDDDAALHGPFRKRVDAKELDQLGGVRDADRYQQEGQIEVPVTGAVQDRAQAAAHVSPDHAVQPLWGSVEMANDGFGSMKGELAWRRRGFVAPRSVPDRRAQERRQVAARHLLGDRIVVHGDPS